MIGDWYKINYKGKEGFIHKIGVTNALEFRTGYAIDGVNIRTAGGNLYSSLRQGTKVSGKVINNWIYYQLNGRVVRVYSPYFQDSRVLFKGFTKGISNIRAKTNLLSDSILR